MRAHSIPPRDSANRPTPLTRTEPAKLQVGNIRHGSAQPCSGSDFSKMFLATTRHRGPAQHPSAATLARSGPRARAFKNYDATVTKLSRTATSWRPRAELQPSEMTTQILQMAEPTAAHSHEQAAGRDIDKFSFSTLLTPFIPFAPSPHP